MKIPRASFAYCSLLLISFLLSGCYRSRTTWTLIIEPIPFHKGLAVVDVPDTNSSLYKIDEFLYDKKFWSNYPKISPIGSSIEVRSLKLLRVDSTGENKGTFAFEFVFLKKTAISDLELCEKLNAASEEYVRDKQALILGEYQEWINLIQRRLHWLLAKRNDPDNQEEANHFRARIEELTKAKSAVPTKFVFTFIPHP